MAEEKTCPRCGGYHGAEADCPANPTLDTHQPPVRESAAPPDATVDLPLLPERLRDRYSLLGVLGEGGFGTVFRVHDRLLDRQVAIKVFKGKDISPEARERWRREARSLAALQHPSVATLYDADVSETGGYLILEFVEGESLRALLRRGPVAPGEACRIAASLAAGLEAAHARGIWHRDVKPENVLLTPGGVPKLTDFGIARISGEDTVTAEGIVLGTPAYMAPEQVEGRPVDGKCDVFSLGCILQEMLTGKKAFPGDTPSQVLTKILSQPPQALPPSVALPPHVAPLLQSMMSKNPALRPSAAEVRKALEETSTVPVRVARAVERRKALLGLAALAVGGVSLVLTLWLWRNGGVPAEAPPPANPPAQAGGMKVALAPFYAVSDPFKKDAATMTDLTLDRLRRVQGLRVEKLTAPVRDEAAAAAALSAAKADVLVWGGAYVLEGRSLVDTSLLFSRPLQNRLGSLLGDPTGRRLSFTLQAQDVNSTASLLVFLEVAQDFLFGRTDEALALAKKIQDPAQWMQEWIGQEADYARRLPEALTWYRAAWANGEPQPRLALAIADVLGGMGDEKGATDWVAKAEAEARKQAQARPNDPRPLMALASVLRVQGRYDDALKAYDQAIAVDPSMASAPINKANVYLSIMREGDEATAQAALRSIQAGLRLAPKSAFGWDAWGRLCLAQGDLDCAAEKFRRGIESDPEAYDPYNNYAEVLMELGRYPAALDNYKRAQELARLNHAIPVDQLLFAQNVGVGYLAVGRPLEASEQLEVAFSYRDLPVPVLDISCPVLLDLACCLAGKPAPQELASYAPPAWWQRESAATWKAWRGAISWAEAEKAYGAEELWMARMYRGWYLLKERRNAEAREVLAAVLATPRTDWDEWILTRALWEQHPEWGPAPGRKP